MSLLGKMQDTLTKQLSKHSDTEVSIISDINQNNKPDTSLLITKSNWYPQSSINVKKLLKQGYPAYKLKWYRGGMQFWVSVRLTIVTLTWGDSIVFKSNTSKRYFFIPCILLILLNHSVYAASCIKLFDQQKFQSALSQCLSESRGVSSQADFILGELYKNGFFVKRNITRAISYYQQAAKQNNVDSQIKLGQYYATKHDYILSYAYFSLAINNGSLGALLLRDKIEQKLTYENLILAKKKLDSFQR